MMIAGVEIKPSGTTPEQLCAYSELLGRVFGPLPKFTVEALAWLYRDNPEGAVVGTDAWSGDTLVAHYVTIPTRALLQGKSARGLLSLNTATAPQFQGKGLFTTLAEATYAAARAQSFQFVVGFANANSTPGFLRKLAFQKIRGLEAGLLLRPPRQMAQTPTDFQIDWSPTRLAWRLANPAARYRVARQGDLLGIWANTGVPLLRCAAFLPGHHETPSRGDSPWAPPVFIGLEPRLSLAAQGFAPIPARLRPSPLNMIWRRLDDALPETLDPETVAVSFLDFDPY
jgi:GNAT superfamily N-acetyltransferase